MLPRCLLMRRAFLARSDADFTFMPASSFEGRSAGDVARELETTNRYAEKLIHNCLKRVREIYINITAVKK